ncbi:MAG: enoyl-CoA hydratase/isomerase family protein [Deltaproteobacteria bacterium]|nr:enoyl-CoA hydratase/isomerase family protein [Deltaproteobacteria bacterium]
MEKNLVLTEKQDMIGVITLNRPEEMNTFNVPFARALNDTLLDMDQDDDVRVVVIRAAGKHFSTGISLPEFQGKSPGELRNFLNSMDEFYHTLPRMKKPVVASVKGAAVANGAGLVFACDLAVAAENARFGTTAINVGLICLGPAVPLARHVGRKKALEMILTGDIISAPEAQQLGLINKVVPPDDLEAETMKLAAKIAQKSPLAIQIGKTGVYAMSEIPYHQAVDYMDELFASLCSTEDAIEGINAFVEKRKPVWKGR